MKKLLLFLLTFAFIIASTGVYAAQTAPLGSGNIALKLDYIDFTNGDLDDADVDTGVYLGLEGYGEIAKNLYLGMEVGYTQPNGDIGSYDTELTFVPVELNVKYAVESGTDFIIDFGAGASLNYGEFKISGPGLSDSVDDWLFGGQIFTDLNYKIDSFFFGINAKYQITEEFEDEDFDMNNWRIGGQIGIIF
ncbi:MAG: hypothetical protein A2Z47_01835 [Thermodesulfovibrio sp. RBG_19FT_COMBO_42_12]|nr:MAG: hypothetical protein A2Z47_01835 [Thermodesulfovibrio sp. RBG_19FT_COMBO_42_12]